MKFPTLVSKVLEKTAPMSANEQDEIQQKVNVWYSKLYEKAKLKKDNNEELSIIDKGFLMADEWYVRIAFTMVFFWAVRFIQDR